MRIGSVKNLSRTFLLFFSFLPLFLFVSFVNSAFAADNVVGNEVVGASNTTLTRTGAGTAISPYLLRLNLANPNTWTAQQRFNASTLFPFGVWDSSGNVGIGTTTGINWPLYIKTNTNNPSELIESTGADAALSLKNTATNGREYWIDSGSNGAGIGAGNFAIYDRTASASRMTVDSNGNVGIGTTNPAAKLHVNGNIIVNGCTGCGSVSSQWITSGSSIYYNGGNVGIGTTSSNSLLHVGSGAICCAGDFAGVNIGNPSGAYVTTSDGTRTTYMGADGSGYGMIGTFTNHDFVIRANNSEKMRIATSGNVGIGVVFNPGQKLDIVGGNGRVESGYNWLTNSDVRYKTNITTLTNVLDKITNLRGVSYDLKTDKNIVQGQGKQVGFIAQELEKEYPQVVVTDSNGYKSVAYDKMTAVLLQAIKEQQQEIKDLQNQVNILKNK